MPCHTSLPIDRGDSGLSWPVAVRDWAVRLNAKKLSRELHHAVYSDGPEPSVQPARRSRSNAQIRPCWGAKRNSNRPPQRPSKSTDSYLQSPRVTGELRQVLRLTGKKPDDIRSRMRYPWQYSLAVFISLSLQACAATTPPSTPSSLVPTAECITEAPTAPPMVLDRTHDKVRSPEFRRYALLRTPVFRAR